MGSCGLCWGPGGSVGLLRALFGILGALFGILGTLFGILGALFGIMGALFGILGSLLFSWGLCLGPGVSVVVLGVLFKS